MGFLKLIFSAIDRAARKADVEKRQKLALFRRVQTIVSESIRIINTTKSIKTVVIRYKTIEIRLSELMKMFPGDKLEIEFNGKPIKSLADISEIEKARNSHVQEYFRERCADLSKTAGSPGRADKLKKQFQKLRIEQQDLAPGNLEVESILSELAVKLQV